MVKVIKVISVDREAKEAQVDLFADTRTEITDEMEIQGMLMGFSPGFGSSVLTANGEIGFLKSDGTWNWAGEEV